jgi:hypothetical protein
MIDFYIRVILSGASCSLIARGAVEGPAFCSRRLYDVDTPWRQAAKKHQRQALNNNQAPDKRAAILCKNLATS